MKPNLKFQLTLLKSTEDEIERQYDELSRNIFLDHVDPAIITEKRDQLFENIDYAIRKYKQIFAFEFQYNESNRLGACKSEINRWIEEEYCVNGDEV